MEKALMTEEASDINQNFAPKSSQEIFCIDNGNSSESKNLDDYADESTSNKV
jgi:hypothetical protein